MRRFIVGVLATIGAFTVLAFGVAIGFATSGPLATKSLPDAMVLSLDLRTLPAESESPNVLRGDFWNTSHDMARTLQLLRQAVDDPRVVGMYVEIGDED